MRDVEPSGRRYLFGSDKGCSLSPDAEAGGGCVEEKMPVGLPFVVGEQPYCLWSADAHDIRESSLTFLRGVDASYFEYLARVHSEQVDDHGQHAAIALRTAYHHGLESFFSLLFAAVQAPACVFAWLQKYEIWQLRELVRRIDSGALVRNKLSLDAPTWEALSERLNLFRYDDPKRLEETRQLFADLWRNFAHDFLNPDHANEYNSVKHGFRMRAGGFALAVGLEVAPGVPPPDTNMQMMGSSEFGTSYFVAEPLPRNDRKSKHFRVRRDALNWSPAGMVAGVQLLGISINNIVSCLSIMHGVSPKEVAFHRPEDSAAFDEPWREHSGLTRMSVNATVAETAVKLAPDEELLAVYDRASV